MSSPFWKYSKCIEHVKYSEKCTTFSYTFDSKGSYKAI